MTFPDHWRLSRVEDEGRVQLGRQRHPDWHTGPNMHPYLRVANVFEDRIDTTDVMEMDFTDCFERYRLQPGDVLLNEGQSPELLGRPAIYRGIPENSAFTNSLIRFQAGPEVTPDWSLLVFRHYMHSGRFTRESRITTNIAHLSATRFKKVEFPVPPLQEQRRIVEIVEDHLSHLNAADASLALAGRRAVALGASVREDSIAGSFFPLGEIAAIQGGIQKQPKRAPKENSFPFLRVANVTGDGLNLDEVHQVELFDDEIERWRLAAGDLLVVEGNGSAAQIGRSCLWDGSIPECVHQNHIIRVRPQSSMIPEYLELVWNSPSLRAELTRIASSSSGLHTLSVAKLKRLVVPRPPLEIQQQLIGEAQRVLEDAKRLRAMVAVLQQRSLATRRGVLAAAFSGRLTGASVDSEVIEELAQG